MLNLRTISIIGFQAALLYAASPAQADEVTFTELDWDASKVINQVLAQVISEKLKVPVKIRPGNTEDSLVSMDAGNGTYDVFPDIWMPNRQDAWVKYVDERKTIGHNDGYEAIQGFFVPTAIAEKYKIQGIDDLKNADLARLFDTDGNGLGEYWAGEKTWGATRLNRIKMKSYGLDKLWEARTATNDEFKATLATSIDKQSPILFYHWTPEWIFGAYKLTQLKEPDYYKGCDKVFTPEERSDWLDASTFACAFESSHVHIFYSRSLDKRYPEVAALLQNIDFDPEVINAWVGETGRESKSPESVARDWLKMNPQIVDGWLSKVQPN